MEGTPATVSLSRLLAVTGVVLAILTLTLAFLMLQGGIPGGRRPFLLAVFAGGTLAALAFRPAALRLEERRRDRGQRLWRSGPLGRRWLDRGR